MAIGERIKFIRNMRGMTQKCLGMAIGFSENTADVRISQYESGDRTPKENMITKIACVLKVCSQALAIPDIGDPIGIAHTLFALEDMYGIRISIINGELCLVLDKSKGATYLSIFDMFSAWQQESEKLRIGIITKEEYDDWRYNYRGNKKTMQTS